MRTERFEKHSTASQAHVAKVKCTKSVYTNHADEHIFNILHVSQCLLQCGCSEEN